MGGAISHLFGGLTQPGSALQSPSGQTLAVGAPQQMLGLANQSISAPNPSMNSADPLGLSSVRSTGASPSLPPFLARPGENPVGDVSQSNPSMDALAANRNLPTFKDATFAQASHDSLGMPTAASPALSTKGKVLQTILQGGLGALAGRAASEQALAESGGRRNGGFGSGAIAGMNLPFLQAGQRQAVQHGNIQNEQAQANLDITKTGVTVPGVGVLPLPIAKALYPTILRGETQENIASGNRASREKIAGGNQAINLRKQGLKLDENGNQVPVPYEELTPAEQGTIDLKQAQQDAAQAKAALDTAKNDPTSPAYKAAYGRLMVAQQNANTALGKLGLDQKKYNADYLGLGPDGQALPGTPTDEKTGQPIGPRVANAGAASSDRLRRGDLANNAAHNLDNISEIVKRRPEIFGPASGFLNSIENLAGSNDKDLARLGVEIHNYALAANGAHGVRSAEAIRDTENELLNHLRRGPAGIEAAIDAAKSSLGTFQDAAKRGKRPQPAPQPQATAPDVSKATATAIGPNGEKIYAIGGKWVDAKGTPIQ